MYWLSRPPLIRYALAVVALLAGLWFELRPSDVVLHPFATADIATGVIIEAEDVEYRPVPRSLLPEVQLPIMTGRPVHQGEPILPGGTPPAVPADWWALEVPSPRDLAPGTQVRLVITSYDEPPLSTLGLVVSSDEQFGEPTVLVAVAEDWATIAATAAQEGRVTLLVGAGGSRVAGVDP